MLRILLVTIVLLKSSAEVWETVNLPSHHIAQFYNNKYPNLAKKCSKDATCPYNNDMNLEKCWGYEVNCGTPEKEFLPSCPEDHRGWAVSKQGQKEMFWKSGDFGLIRKRREELKKYCVAKNESDSELQCVNHLRFCRAKHIYMDFRKFDFAKSEDRLHITYLLCEAFTFLCSFSENVFKPGDIGGHCVLEKKALKSQGDHKSALQSWFGEFEHYTSLNFRPATSHKKHCDVTIKTPVVFLKLDAGINMFHHFCDFVNLYAAQHLNGSFAQDITLVMWDTSNFGYTDFFDEMWKVFSNTPIVRLNRFEKLRVCVHDALFPFLPRMRYGLFYNMPLVPGCQNSELMKAFAHHSLHRLGIEQMGPKEKKIRVTILERKTNYRNILNQAELVKKIKGDSNFEVRVVNYSNMKFSKQVEITHNSDIFIGMHGAGLTHMLFQPDWGVIFELYHCDDPDCYNDLARLRGLRYLTWERMDKLFQEDEGHHPTLGAHKKFTNYSFDRNELMRLLRIGAQHVRSHPAYRQMRRKKFPHLKDEL